MNYLLAIAVIISLPLMGMHSNSNENNNKVFQLCKEFANQQAPTISHRKNSDTNFMHNIDNEPKNLKALQNKIQKKKHQQITKLMLNNPVAEMGIWAEQHPYAAKEFLRQEDTDSPLGALCIIQATDSPATNTIYTQIWKNLGYASLSEQDKKEVNSLTGFSFLYRITSKKHIQDIMLQKINPIDVTLLNSHHLNTLNELTEIYKTENKRLVPVSKELLAKIKQLPPEILDCCVQSSSNKSDKLLYIYVPSTMQDNIKNVAFAAAGGGAIGGLLTLIGKLTTQGIVNIGNQAEKACRQQAKQKIVELINPVTQEYITNTMYKPNELNTIASDNFHDILSSDIIAIEEASLPFALKTARDYSEVVKRNIYDKEYNETFFEKKVVQPVIQATVHAANDSIVQTIGNPKSYSDNLDTKSLVKDTAIGIGIGAGFGALWELRNWNKPMVPSTAIKYINQADKPESDTLF